MTGGRLTRLLPLACLLAAIVLFASELMTTFEFTPPGGEPLATRSGHDLHGSAMILIAVFAVFALAVAVFAASKPAAVAVGVAGVAALLIFLIGDLPDANAVGTLNDARQSYFDAEAVPQEGFFLEMLGALALAIGGIALATMSPEQLAALRHARRERESGPAHQERAKGTTPEGRNTPAETEVKSRLPRRPRARQRG